MIALDQVQLLWTPNFDQLIERSISHAAITKRISKDINTVGLDCPAKAMDVIRDETWPVLVKLHGDFRYRKLKNTTDELRDQDATLQKCLTEQCGRRGLAVVGYSGRDQSVMSALAAALEVNSDPFPHGLFWFERAGATPRPAVISLLTHAREKDCQAACVEIGGFDELMADLFLPHHEAFPDVRDIVKNDRKGRRPVSLSYAGRQWPVLRTNALEVTKYPSTCTIFTAEIGGAKDVKQVAGLHRDRLTAGRSQPFPGGLNETNSFSASLLRRTQRAGSPVPPGKGE